MENTQEPREVAPWRWALIGVLLLAAVVAGYASGQHAQDEEASKYGVKLDKPEPTANVAPTPYTVIEVEEVEVPIQACLTALDLVDAMFDDVLIPLADLMDEALNAVDAGDPYWVELVMNDMDALQPIAAELASDYDIAAEECRRKNV